MLNVFCLFYPLLSVVLPMSAEEEQLWSIVRSNSSDLVYMFESWTKLIEETEKNSGVWISNIR